jgi:hypothetical protein
VFYAVLFCLPLVCQGRGAGLHDRFIQIPAVSDTIKKKQKKGSEPLPDTIRVTYENGQLTSPNKLSRQQLKDLSRQSASGIRSKWRERRRAENGPESGQVTAFDKKQRKADSLIAMAENTSSFTRQLKPRTQFPGARIHSDKRIKEMYDSAGVDKMDTLLALAKSKKPVSENELLDKINSSMGMKDYKDPSSDLSKVRLRDEALQELTPLTGRSLKPDYRQAADSLLNKALGHTPLDSMSIPDSVTQVKGAKIISYKNPNELDSLKKIYTGKDSVVYMPKAKADSIKIAWLHAVQLKQEKLRALVSGNRADSLNNLATRLRKNSLNEKVVSDKLSEVPIPVKHGIFHRFYFEGLVSFNKTSLQDEVRLSPGLGFLITDDFSVGGGLNVLIARREKQTDVLTGYRVFTKYQFLKQRAYVQVEDWVEPSRRMGEGNKPLSRHSILAGAGYVLALGNSIGINGGILYRVNNEHYSGGLASPWVFRIGISSIRSKHK